jgi:tetratricopeptide (TPR) repeat protein
VTARPSRLAHLERARAALDAGNVDDAVAALHHGATDPRDAADRALYRLHLAATDALYGRGGVARGRERLREAAALDGAVVDAPLYRALHAEFRALEGASASSVRRAVDGVDAADPVAAYHAASALWWAGAARAARRRLRAVPDDAVPAYLQWRRWSLLGHAHADLGEVGAAAEAFAHAWEGAGERDRDGLRRHFAAALLEVGRPREAGAVLDVAPHAPVRGEEVAWEHELRGRVDLALGNPGRALEHLDAAAGHARDEERRLAIATSRADALADLGRPDDAAAELDAVRADAPHDERAYLAHELAILYVDADRLDEARATLDDLLSDPDYPHRADALADLADVHLRLGDLRAAQDAAERALAAGAEASACLTLGTVAFEYFDLHDAVAWLERAVATASEGDPTWLAAQHVLVDAHAQRGAVAAPDVVRHARAALEHADPAGEDAAALQAALVAARRQLGGRDRVVN